MDSIISIIIIFSSSSRITIIIIITSHHHFLHPQTVQNIAKIIMIIITSIIFYLVDGQKHLFL